MSERYVLTFTCRILGHQWEPWYTFGNPVLRGCNRCGKVQLCTTDGRWKDRL